MALPDPPSIVIAGAGSIGCYVGGCLALAGRRVRFLARPDLADALKRRGLRVSSLDGTDSILPGNNLSVTADPAAALVRADIVLVTVKSGATPEMAELIAAHVPPRTIVVSLQNGVDNVPALRARLGSDRPIVAGMVPFNVIQTRLEGAAVRVHRATSGTILIEEGVEGLRQALDVSGARVAERADMDAVQWGKLIFNLNNALNALSGLPLATQLGDRTWRRLLADQMEEALACLNKAHVRAKGVEGVPLGLVPYILRLPDGLFRLVAGRMLAIDPAARSSMWEDFEKHRPSEIDHLQGAILDLARRSGQPAPLTERIVAHVKAAERKGAGSPHLQPADIRSTAGT